MRDDMDLLAACALIVTLAYLQIPYSVIALVLGALCIVDWSRRAAPMEPPPRPRDRSAAACRAIPDADAAPFPGAEAAPAYAVPSPGHGTEPVTEAPPREALPPEREESFMYSQAQTTTRPTLAYVRPSQESRERRRQQERRDLFDTR